MTISIGQIDTLVQELHKVDSDLKALNEKKNVIRSMILNLMIEGQIKSRRTIWGLITLKAGKTSRVYDSDKIKKWEASIAAEKAKLDTLGKYTETVGSPTVAFTASK
jgi:hypothetical protein